MGLGTVVFTTILGFIFLGPVGAILGVFLGMFLNRSQNTNTFQFNRNSTTSRQRAHVNSSQLYFYKQLYGMLAKLAQADGQITQQEINIIDNFTEYELNLPHTLKNEVKNLFDQALEDNTDFETYAQNFYNLIGNQPSILARVIELMNKLSSANGGRSSRQTDLLSEAINIFGLSRKSYRNRSYRRSSNQKEQSYNTTDQNLSSSSEKDPYEVLDCSPEDSTKEIKQKYRELVKEYHPDRIISKDLPDDFVEYANKRFKEIQKAYEKIMKRRGEK